MADYLEAYAARFHLPVRSGVRVDWLRREGERFVVEAAGQRLEADQVIVAMANYQRPRVPDFAARARSSRPAAPLAGVPEPGAAAGGAGAGGGRRELGRRHRGGARATRPTLLSGKETGHIPFPIDGAAGRLVLSRLVRFVGHHVLTVSTPIGRPAPAPAARVPPPRWCG